MNIPVNHRAEILNPETGIPRRSTLSPLFAVSYHRNESPHMTAHYAHIHDSTLKKAFIQYQRQTINIHSQTKLLEAQWLKKNLVPQSLPNGLYALPLTQQRFPHANVCLTYANFRTNEAHLSQHKAQLKATQKLIENTKTNGWQRIVEVNTDICRNLESIITTLEKTSHDNVS